MGASQTASPSKPADAEKRVEQLEAAEVGRRHIEWLMQQPPPGASAK